MSKYMRYKHHGVWTYVRRDLKGKHGKHCLCWNCALFTPHDGERNCPIAEELYAFDIRNQVTTQR